RARRGVQREGCIAEDELDTVEVVDGAVTEEKIVGARPIEHRRQVDAVVRPPPFLADDDETMAGVQTALDRGLHEAMPDHSVADDEDGGAGSGSRHGQTPSNRRWDGRR